jgi:ABC-type dipeptide/oligopeptide/nickel transport system ATPase component
MRLLIVGKTGVGKTWLMKSLIEYYKVEKRLKIGKVYFHSNGNVHILGKYDGSTFEGSDRLSMSVITDLELFLHKTQGVIIAEGDRFTNSRFIRVAAPVVIKILGDGSEGRLKRGSNQTDRHIKAISTRVDNIIPKFEVQNSMEALTLIKKLIDNE